MAALVQSFFTAWIQTETDPSDTPFNEVGAGDIAGVPAEVNADGGPLANNLSDDDSEYEMGPGTVTHLAARRERSAFGNPNIPHWRALRPSSRPSASWSARRWSCPTMC
ncbi:MAG: hypothetical protein ACLSAF_22380 [Intestinimonas sp.]